MREFLAAAKAGAIKGLREAPRGYFAPVTAVARFFLAAYRKEACRSAHDRSQPRMADTR